MTFDSAGTLYVGADSEIDVFPAGSTTPVQVITGALTQLVEVDGIAVSSQGEIFVTNGIVGLGSVLVFSAGANGNTAPARTIFGINGNVPFYDPSGIALDAAGDLFVSSYVTPATSIASPAIIYVFAPGASGFPVPAKTIAGPATGLNGVGCLRFDAAGNLFVLIISPVSSTAGTTYQPSVAVFAPSASGNAAPLSSFSSPAWTSTGSGQLGLY